jgi:hypothetical protein
VVTLPRVRRTRDIAAHVPRASLVPLCAHSSACGRDRCVAAARVSVEGEARGNGLILKGEMAEWLKARFLWCGFLAGGFARFRCGGCTTERHARRVRPCVFRSNSDRTRAPCRRTPRVAASVAVRVGLASRRFVPRRAAARHRLDGGSTASDSRGDDGLPLQRIDVAVRIWIDGLDAVDTGSPSHAAADSMRFHSAAPGRPPTHLMPMFAAERRRSASCAP